MIREALDLWLEQWRGLFEIILLSVGIYYGYLYFRGTRGAKVLTGLAIVFLTLTLISQLLNLTVIGWIIRSFSVFLAVALVVIFQPELRRGLAELGGHPIFSLTSEKRETVHDIAEAVMQLANKQFGALIAIERLALTDWEDAGRSRDTAVPHYHSSIVQRAFRMEERQHQLHGKDRVHLDSCFFVDSYRRVALDCDQRAKLLVRELHDRFRDVVHGLPLFACQ